MVDRKGGDSMKTKDLDLQPLPLRRDAIYQLVPSPYDKYYALDQYCMRKGLNHDQVVYFGDDITLGGGDYSLYHSDFPFVCVDDYHHFKQLSAFLLV